MEPTLQAALLSKAVWDQFVMVEELYIKHELNGMAKRKPSREKKLEFKQHQVCLKSCSLFSLQKK